jgi:hypothetical protein
VSIDDSESTMVEEPARKLLRSIGCRCEMPLVVSCSATNPRSGFVEVGVNPVGLAVFPLVV